MSNEDTNIDRPAQIERLAALDPIEYEAVRVDAAKTLGVRASALDREVAKTRRKLGLDTDDEDDGQGRAVKIVDIWSWSDPVDGDYLATTLAAAIKTYVVVPDAAADTIAFWIIHTWLVDRFTISPRLAITSPTKGCGKTTILRLLNQIVRRPKRAGSISPPALFRAVEKFRPTILLDETEKYIEHGGDLHALINEGHAKGGSVLRVLGEKLDLREFRIFSAVAFARNGRVPDDLEQRSIVIEMQRRRPDEALAELRDDRCQVLHDLARMCSRWAEDNAAGVVDIDPDMAGLINRDADNWRPLFAIADVIGADWPDRIRQAAIALRPSESESTGPMLLADIKTVFDTKLVDRLASTDLCEALATMEGRPWPEWRVSKGASPKPITPNQLARLLKPFGIVTNTTIRTGLKTAKGYYRTQFDEAWQRYTPSQEGSERSHGNNTCGTATSATFQKVTPDPVVTDQKCEKPNNDGPCYRVTDREADNTPPRMNDDDQLGLSWRAIDRITRDIEEWVYGRRDDGDTTEVQIEEEARRRLREIVLPEWIEVELDRVLSCLYEGQ